MAVPKVLKTADGMKRYCSAVRKRGEKIALVPTMGAIHDGHLRLIEETFRRADVCVVSIFVNPLQFGACEDYNRYKRDEKGDFEKLSSLGVHAVFMPSSDEMYPEGFQTSVEVEQLQQFLCGHFRPGHFKGVATVVLKLFNIVRPDVAVFGEKDFQQLAVIRRMARDLHLDVQIVAVQTVRDGAGLAISSRNEYLSDEEREKAVVIAGVLFRMKKVFDSGVVSSAEILKHGRDFVSSFGGGVDFEYIEICSPETLEPVETAQKGSLAAVAARIGKVRLIDSVRF